MKLITILLFCIGTLQAQTQFASIEPINYTSSYNPQTQSIRFDANVMNQQVGTDDVETIFGTVHFVFDLDAMKLSYVDDADNGEASYDENIIDVESFGNNLAIWSESAYFEIKYVPLENGGRRIALIMEYPYIGYVNYRQYYMRIKPIMAKG